MFTFTAYNGLHLVQKWGGLEFTERLYGMVDVRIDARPDGRFNLTLTLPMVGEADQTYVLAGLADVHMRNRSNADAPHTLDFAL